MRELISRKERKEMIMRYLVNNPDESLRFVAGRFGVDDKTVRNYKKEIADFSPQKKQKMGKSPHPKPNQLAVNGLPLNPSEIQARFNQLCQEMATLRVWCPRAFIGRH